MSFSVAMISWRGLKSELPLREGMVELRAGSSTVLLRMMVVVTSKDYVQLRTVGPLGGTRLGAPSPFNSVNL